MNFGDVFVGSYSFWTSRMFIVSQAFTAAFKFSCLEFHCGKWWCRVPTYRLQLIFDLRRRIAFKNKYLVTARYSILFWTHSNDCYITTARPKWLKLWWVTVNRWTTKFTSFNLRMLLSLCWGQKLFRPLSYMYSKQKFQIIFRKV